MIQAHTRNEDNVMKRNTVTAVLVFLIALCLYQQMRLGTLRRRVAELETQTTTAARPGGGTNRTSLSAQAGPGTDPQP